MAIRIVLASLAVAFCVAAGLPDCDQDDSCATDIAEETQFVQLNQRFGPLKPTPHPYRKPTPYPTPSPTPKPPPPMAHCLVFTEGRKDGATVAGRITFEESKSKQSFTLITYSVCGLEPGLHGFHVHEKADFSNGCLSTLNHYNPFFNNHGAATDRFKHLGDLGNILVAEDGCANGTNLQSDLPFLEGQNNTILGRSCVVHAKEDDLGQGGDDASRGPAGGNAGGRVACGPITIAPTPI